jgi:hypothetical protein
MQLCMKQWALVIAVAFSVCAAPLSTAQTNPTTTLMTLTTAENCKLIWEAGQFMKEITLGRVDADRCERGLVQGGIVFGYASVLAQPKEAEIKTRWVRAAVYVDGRQQGLSLSFNDFGVAWLGGLASGGSVRLSDAGSTSFPLSKAKDAIDQYSTEAGNASPKATATFLKMMAEFWAAQPTEALKYAAPAVSTAPNPGWIGLPKGSLEPSTPQLNAVDDPKVMGGGKRPQ